MKHFITTASGVRVALSHINSWEKLTEDEVRVHTSGADGYNLKMTLPEMDDIMSQYFVKGHYTTYGGDL